MKTEIKPSKVTFNEEGYKDIVSKIEGLEIAINDYQKTIIELQTRQENFVVNLMSNFKVEEETIKILFRSKECMIYIDSGSSDKPVMHVRQII